MKIIRTHQLIFFILIIIISFVTASDDGRDDSLTSSMILRDGDTLTSASGIFALGFFSPINSSTKRYVAIWYNKITTHDIVWVANRNRPITEPTAALTLSSNGTLLITGGNPSIVYWSSSTFNGIDDAIATTTNPIAQLLDTGNLVIRGSGTGMRN